MKRGMSGIITSVIIIGIALAAIGIVWFVINTVVSEQTSQVENTSSKVFQSCKDAGYYKMNTGDVCQGVVSYLGGEKCCQSGLVVNYGLISYWSFDVNASDDWGNNDGTVYGATWNSTGGFNGKGAYEFDGVNDYVSFGNDKSLNITDAITIEVWLYPLSQTYTYPGLVSKGASLGYLLDLTSLSPSFLLAGLNDTSLICPSAVNLNTWQHIVVIYSSSTGAKSIYLNSSLECSESASGQINPISSAVQIGMQGGQYFNGTLDEVRIYNRALSADEVRALYELS